MSVRVGGRPRRIEQADIVRAGRDIGMRDLSLGAVAAQLGVSSTALYRHVDGRWGLEKLIGESLLGELDLPDDPSLDVVQHLVSFATGLRAAVLRHPGLAAYLQILFPRGDAGRRLLADQIAALARRGYAPDAALMVCSAIASIAIGLAAAEDAQRSAGEELAAHEDAALAQVRADARLDAAHQGLPEVDAGSYSRLVLTAVVRGLVDQAPPGRDVAELVTELEALAGDR